MSARPASAPATAPPPSAAAPPSSTASSLKCGAEPSPGQPAPNVSLLALGGYGRKDLFPYSDIDVLFAFADEKTEEQSREAVRAIIQGMWDIGLRASPSSRTVKEAGRFDPDNLEFTLATLDRRFLAGQFPLYQQLHQTVFPASF